MIERKEYMNLLEKWRDKKAIKVVTGIRRCGKSSLLRMFREKLLSDGVSEEQVQNLNFEDLDNEPFLDYKILYAHVKQNLCPDKNMCSTGLWNAMIRLKNKTHIEKQ